MIEIRGRGAAALEQEAGGHRIQRVPPTEKRDRVQSSTVTVAVLAADQPMPAGAAADRSEGAYEISWYAGTGSGGQHRNKHANCCRIRHLPTGLVRTATGRSRQANLRDARAALDADLNALLDGQRRAEIDGSRRQQVGTGQRGDKVRTYRAQDNRAVDHRTGRKSSFTRVMAGGLDRLWSRTPPSSA